MGYNVESIRKEFDALGQKVHGKPLVYFDSAATTLKPRSVVDRVTRHMAFETSNVHRGVHHLSNQATEMFEDARKTVQKFINSDDGEVVFTHGTTESINIVASGFAQALLSPADEILITELEHHSNLVPWQMAALRSGAKLKYVSVNEDGEFSIEDVRSKLSPRTKVMAITGMSNTLGTIPNLKAVIAEAHKVGAAVLVDGAQLISNHKIDVKDLNCDFFAFSGHKLFGPTGTGVLYGKADWLRKLPPCYGGGAMIDKVTFEKTTFLEPPFRFEAGTPDIAGIIGMAEGIRFFELLDISKVEKYEAELTAFAVDELRKINQIRVLGPRQVRGPIISFVANGTHHHDIGSVLDQEGVAVRTGHHCTQPLLEKFGLTGTVRASLSVYSTAEEVEKLAIAIRKALQLLA